MNLFKQQLLSVFLIPVLFIGISGVITQPQEAHAQNSLSSAAVSGFSSGLATCAAQIGSQIVGSSVASNIGGRLLSVADFSSVPVSDGGVQAQQVTNQTISEAREGCIDGILYSVAKKVLNQLADSTLKWVESGFTEFGQTGNRAFVGNVDNFLSNVSQQTFNRFMSDVGSGNSNFSEVCGAFNDDVLRKVGQSYFQHNQEPSGVEFDESILDDAAGRLSDNSNCGIGIGQDSLEAFIQGDFEEGGWETFMHTVENPNANPVGAFLQQNQNLTRSIQNAKDTNLTELENNDGWLSQISCGNSGGLNANQNRCKDGSEPTITTPGTVVNNTINRAVESDFQRLELADEVNEIVGALGEQLVSNVVGGGSGSGSGEKGLFSQAARENSSTLGNLDEYADGNYGNDLQAEYVRDTLSQQIELELELREEVRKLPTTNEIALLEARINQCLNRQAFGDPEGDQASQIEQQLQQTQNANNSAFPTNESSGEKEIGPQKIDWVGNDLEDWNYGETQGLDSCEQFSDAYNVSYEPDRETQSWEAFMCVSQDYTAFNETRSELEGGFEPIPDRITNALNIPDNLPLYRNARNQQIKIDWNGDDLDWQHYDPFAKDFSNWMSEHMLQTDDDATSLVGDNLFLRENHVKMPGYTVGDGEGERIDQVAKEVGDTNRYGAPNCDKRNLGALSYVVKPLDDVWTIQECKLASEHEIAAFGSTKTVSHYRFVDIPLSEYENGEKPPAFREAQDAVDSRGEYLTKINNLLGDQSFDDSYTAPTSEPDNLREIQHDLETIDEGNPGSEELANRQQAINRRFGQIEKRFHTEDDINSVTEALTTLNPSNPDSTYSQLLTAANNNNCQEPDDWTAPNPGGGGEGGGGEGGEDTSLEISEFTANRTESGADYINISWEATADECVAKSNPSVNQWSGAINTSGQRLIREEGSIDLTLQCQTGQRELIDKVRVPRTSPDPFGEDSDRQIQ